MTPFTFDTTPRLLAGPGAVARLGDLAARLGPRPLVVTDAGILAAGLLERALAPLRGAGAAVAVFDRVVADPPEAVILDAVEAARVHGATGVVGFGGGSSLDAAKLVALLARSDEALGDVYGVGLARGPRLPLVAVPTTAGTGSEVTPISIVTTGTHEKRGVVSTLLIPDAAVLDPELTLGLPPHVTAATGVDAMVHAIEALTSRSPNANPISRALAREALRLLGANLHAAVHRGGDLAARGAMLLGSLLAGQAFANAPVAAVHALAYPLGGRHGVAHGLSNALVLPHVLRFNAPAAAEDYAAMAPLVFPDLAGAAGLDGALAFADRLAGLAVQVGLPARLREVGVAAGEAPVLAQDAMRQTRLLVNNPREVTLPDAAAIYEAAW